MDIRLTRIAIDIGAGTISLTAQKWVGRRLRRGGCLGLSCLTRSGILRRRRCLGLDMHWNARILLQRIYRIHGVGEKRKNEQGGRRDDNEHALG